jgi:hypothetical protein
VSSAKAARRRFFGFRGGGGGSAKGTPQQNAITDKNDAGDGNDGGADALSPLTTTSPPLPVSTRRRRGRWLFATKNNSRLVAGGGDGDGDNDTDDDDDGEDGGGTRRRKLKCAHVWRALGLPAVKWKPTAALFIVAVLVAASVIGVTLLSASLYAVGLLVLLGCISAKEAKAAIQIDILLTIVAAFAISSM